MADTRNTGVKTVMPLAASATYTGVWEQNDEEDVMVTCKADQTGTLFFEFSDDRGTTVSTFPVSGFALAANIYEFHIAVKGPRWFRVRIVNDAVAQTSLALHIYYGTFRHSNAPLNQSASLDADAVHVRPTEMQEEVSLGRRGGVTAWSKFGHRSLLAAGGFETVWDTTGNYTPPAVATAMRIAYDGTGGGSTDGAGTNGAHTLAILYIDGDGLPATMTHTLGTDGSDDTTETTLGINRIAVTSAGTDGFNASDITVTAVTGGAKLAVVPAENAITQQAFFHCGSNHQTLFKFLFIHMNKSSGGAATVQFKGFIYNRTTGITAEVFRLTLDDSVEVELSLNPVVPFLVPATGVLYFTADTSRDGAEAVIRFSGNEYQNT